MTDPDLSRPENAPSRTPPSLRDRVISPVAGRFSGGRGRWITLAALGAGCAAFLFATWDRDAPSDAASLDEPARRFVPFEPARRAADPPLLSEGSADPDAPTLGDAPVIPPIEGGTAAPPERTGLSPEETRRALADSAQRAPLLAFSRPGGSRSGPVPPAGGAEAADRLAAEPTPWDRLRQFSPVDRTRADRLPDRRFLITAGALLPCLLQTALDSATPGYVSCLLPRDIYSDDGSVILLERGTRVLGEYRSSLERGRGRLFVLWTRAVTPGGVAVSLASPAADDLGRAGFDGRIESHFWERFGGALLLSVVDGATTAAADAGVERSTARSPSDAAAVALQDSVGIPPTLRKNQGAEVSIFVARDLDFRDVYRLGVR